VVLLIYKIVIYKKNIKPIIDNKANILSFLVFTIIVIEKIVININRVIKIFKKFIPKSVPMSEIEEIINITDKKFQLITPIKFIKKYNIYNPFFWIISKREIYGK